MKGNKLIRLWVHRGSGGIDDTSPLRRPTGVINAAATTIVSILLTFIMTPVRKRVEKRKRDGLAS